MNIVVDYFVIIFRPTNYTSCVGSWCACTFMCACHRTYIRSNNNLKIGSFTTWLLGTKFMSPTLMANTYPLQANSLGLQLFILLPWVVSDS